MAVRDAGANDWWLSGYVNLLAAGVAANDAKAIVVLWAPPDQQTDLAAVIDEVAAACLTMAEDTFDVREASGWHYLTSSPMQTYEVYTPP